MKYRIFFTIALIALMSCNNLKENEFIISGKIEGLKDGTKIFLEKQGETTPIEKVDTAIIKDGKFEFRNEFKETGFYFIGFDESIMGKISFIAEHGEIEVLAKKDSLNLAKVVGTVSNDAVREFYFEGAMKEKKKYFDDNNQKFQKALTDNDTVTQKKLIEGMKVFDDKIEKSAVKHINENTESYLALVFIEQKINNPDADLKQIKSWYDKLDEKLKKTKSGKNIKNALDNSGIK